MVHWRYRTASAICCWTLIPLFCHWPLLRQGYWRYGKLIDWLKRFVFQLVHNSCLTVDLTINQSINQTYIASISQAKPGSVARQPNQCSTAKSRKQFSHINMSSGMSVLWGKGQVKEMCRQMFLKGSNWICWTKKQREVVPKRRGTTVKSSCTIIGLDPRDWQTIIIVWSQWTGRNRCCNHGVTISRLFFTQGFVGQHIDLKSILNLTGNKWRERSSRRLRVNAGDCHQAGQMIPLKYSAVDASNTIQKWIAIIKTTGHKSSCR